MLPGCLTVSHIVALMSFACMRSGRAPDSAPLPPCAVGYLSGPKGQNFSVEEREQEAASSSKDAAKMWGQDSLGGTIKEEV